ncbi:unnamed protein product [Toxocara canis]|uniref:Palmitoyltransferase n=1 Tax=Toxocara canis TaxID=6265 RepID=A0A3P7GN25_TOXCA|nr:unnamed protein product [Toxocara canis]
MDVAYFRYNRKMAGIRTKKWTAVDLLIHTVLLLVRMVRTAEAFHAVASGLPIDSGERSLENSLKGYMLHVVPLIEDPCERLMNAIAVSALLAMTQWCYFTGCAAVSRRTSKTQKCKPIQYILLEPQAASYTNPLDQFVKHLIIVMIVIDKFIIAKTKSATYQTSTIDSTIHKMSLCASSCDKSHHCTECGSCILRCDHHCVLMSCCIHQDNLKYYQKEKSEELLFIDTVDIPNKDQSVNGVPIKDYLEASFTELSFILYLFWGLLYSTLAFVTDFRFTYFNESQQKGPFWYTISISYLMCIQLAIWPMIIYSYLIPMNLAFRDRWRQRCPYGDLGWRNNLRRVFGPSPTLWFVPTKGAYICKDE